MLVQLHEYYISQLYVCVAGVLTPPRALDTPLTVAYANFLYDNFCVHQLHCGTTVMYRVNNFSLFPLPAKIK